MRQDQGIRRALSLLVVCGGLAALFATAPSAAQPENRVIILGRSIGGIERGEPRSRVEKLFGLGSSADRGLVRYFEGRLLVDYWFHDGLTTQVEAVLTRWSGFHTRAGVHVGSTRRELRALHVACVYGECSLQAGRMPDAPGTLFTMRHGKVTEIYVGRN